MDPVSALCEIDNIDSEILLLQNKIKELKARRKKLSDIVIVYSKENGGIKEINYAGGKTFKIIEKVQRNRKKEADIKKDTIAVITKHIDGPHIEEIYQEIKKSITGNSKIIYKLKK